MNLGEVCQYKSWRSLYPLKTTDYMKTFGFLICLIITVSLSGQNTETVNFVDEIKQRDISILWILDSIRLEHSDIYVKRLPPLGYIGDNYQRIQVRFISAIQNPENKLEYFIYGKTKVRDNICDFQGTITITKAEKYLESDLDYIDQGFVKGEYKFFEDPKQSDTGTFEGEIRTDFYIDENNKLNYDALPFAAAGFKNNQFEGTWTSYRTGVKRKCNWGDYRIPNSRELDVGASQLMIDEEYWQFGWKNFVKSRSYTLDDPEILEAKKKEETKWWIEN
jgi:hypothetical protein